MKLSIKLLCLTATALVFSSCGSTSSLQTPAANGIEQARYSKVLVKDFSATVMDQKQQVKVAQSYFPDRIAQELRKTGRFNSVTRSGSADAKTLVINGVITRYSEGNAAMRMLVGMGAGSSYFDSQVMLQNNRKKLLGTVKVDKNSWALGGGIAAGQTPTTYMDGAAKKIAKESTAFAK